MSTSRHNKYENLSAKDEEKEKDKDNKYLEYYYGGFKRKYTFDQRSHQSNYMLEKFNYQKIPIVVEYETSFPKKYILNIEKRKYLVSLDYLFGQFIMIIRKSLKLPPKYAITLLVNNSMCRASDYIESVYESKKDKDDFLYVCVCLDATFG